MTEKLLLPVGILSSGGSSFFLNKKTLQTCEHCLTEVATGADGGADS
jgi:hypothetical protein